MKDFEVIHQINTEIFQLLREVCDSHNIPSDYGIRLLLEALKDPTITEALWSKILVLRGQALER